MANVINRKASIRGGVFQFIQSVNTPDFDSTVWLINPDLRAVRGAGVPERHWKVVGDTVIEMTQAEKDVIDAPVLTPDRDSAVVKLKAAIGLTDKEIAAIGFVE